MPIGSDANSVQIFYWHVIIIKENGFFSKKKKKDKQKLQMTKNKKTEKRNKWQTKTWWTMIEHAKTFL